MRLCELVPTLMTFIGSIPGILTAGLVGRSGEMGTLGGWSACSRSMGSEGVGWWLGLGTARFARVVDWNTAMLSSHSSLAHSICTSTTAVLSLPPFCSFGDRSQRRRFATTTIEGSKRVEGEGGKAKTAGGWEGRKGWERAGSSGHTTSNESVEPPRREHEQV